MTQLFVHVLATQSTFNTLNTKHLKSSNVLWQAENATLLIPLPMTTATPTHILIQQFEADRQVIYCLFTC